MEADIQVEKMGKDAASDSADGALRNIRKDGIAQLVEERREYACETVCRAGLSA